MKKAILFSFIHLVLFSCSLSAEDQLSTKDWISDLDFLQETIHQDYSKLFVKISAEEFDKEVEKLRKDIPGLETNEIIFRMTELVALFKYGHTGVSFSRSLHSHGEGQTLNFHSFPVNFYWFSDGLFVQGVHKEYQDIVGAQVIRIGKVEAMEALDRIRPLVSIENESFFKAYGIHNLRIAEILQYKGIIDNTEELPLLLKKDGKEFKTTLKVLEDVTPDFEYGYIVGNENWASARKKVEQDPLWIRQAQDWRYSSSLPENKAYYVRHSVVRNQDERTIADFFDKAMKEFNEGNYEKLIIDVRLNGGGNNYNNAHVIKLLIRSEKLQEPGSLVVITGRRTYSACQSFINEMDNYTPVIFVGEPSAENINFMGDNRVVVLPNSGLNVRLSFAWWQDKPQWENDEWIAPEIYVEMSSEDYADNKDPLLDAALDDELIAIAAGHLEHLELAFKSSEKDKVIAEVKRLIRDPKFRYLPLEDDINIIGYRYMNKKEYESAKLAFWINTEYFPESANAWDSYGEWHMNMGEFDQAISLYEKAISLSEEGDFVNQNAKAMLAKIREHQ